MMRIVVTGATGLLGNNIVRAALQGNHEVIAVSRSATHSKALRGLELVSRDADVTDWDSLSRVCEGRVDAVIHSAAHIHIGWSDREESIRINLEGTRNALRLAAAHGGRFVHISTVNTLAVGSQNQPADENTTGDGQVPCAYVVAKRAAETEARTAIERGQDVIIVYPGFMLGPWDWKPSSGRMILDLSHGAPLLVPPGGCSICDPRDVAFAVLSAVDRSPRGARYVLAGENWTYMRLWSEIAARFGKKAPWTTMRPPGRWVAGVVGDFAGRVLGKEPTVNSAAIQMASQFHWYTSHRAIQELSYAPRPALQSIDDAIGWFREHGLLP